MPAPPTLLCDRCRTVLTAASVNTPEPVACPGCHAPLLTRVFPVFYRATAERPGADGAEPVASDEDASCFYHPRKKAVVPCVQCGRFLCALCDLELDGRHLCPSCVTAPRATPGGRTALQDGLLLGGSGSRPLYDKIALLLAAVPLVPIFWVFTLLTAPLALFFALRHWNEPRRRPMPQGRARLIVATLLALGQIGFWGFVIYQSLHHLSASI